MDCQAARNAFSEYLDARLLPDTRAMIEDHLGRCESCQGEWTFYRRVFASVATMREEPPLRGLSLPREAPGRGDRRPAPVRAFNWPRVRAAASIIILLGLSHAVVFDLARRSHDDEQVEITFNPRGLEVGNRESGFEASEAKLQSVGNFRRRLNDHVDATQLLARQINYLPTDAEDNVRDIVGAQLEALRPNDLYDQLAACGSELRTMAPMAKVYLDSWQRLSDGLEMDLAFIEEGGVLSDQMRRRVVQSPLLYRVAPIRTLLASEPTGLSWREPEAQSRLFGSGYLGRSDEVKSYLIAHEKMLTARYIDSAGHFEGFAQRHESSPLLPLTRYLQAEALRRADFHVDAMRVSSQLRFGKPTPAMLQLDPLALMWTVTRRRLPMGVIQNGTLQLMASPQGQRQLFRPQGFFVEFQQVQVANGGGGRLSIRVQPPSRERAERHRVEH